MATAEVRLEALKQEVRACRLCADKLPLGPHPVLRARVTDRLLIVGQAPGLHVHETGIPWNDPSGERLRAWMDVDHDTFYDESRIAIIPMGLCYPGREPRGGDMPPCPECAPTWHPRLLEHVPNIELTLLVGAYAQTYYLGLRKHGSVTETVRSWREYLPKFFPLPHPSFRNAQWLNANPWFETEVVPALREKIRALLARS